MTTTPTPDDRYSIVSVVILSCGERRKFVGGDAVERGETVPCNGGKCTNHGSGYPVMRKVRKVESVEREAWDS